MKIAFRMRVNPGQEQEYERRHRPIWPELQQVLLDHGVLDYSIFLDDRDGSLFGVAEIRSLAEWEAIAGTEVCRRWWTAQRDIMPTNPDHSPVSTGLREVFHLSAQGR
jgi:L-rhamnose mutarotase